jgi:hypothetical protein
MSGSMIAVTVLEVLAPMMAAYPLAGIVAGFLRGAL